MNLEVRSRIDKYTTEGKTTNFYYARPLYTDMGNLHLLSDIENIIELKELLYMHFKILRNFWPNYAN